MRALDITGERYGRLVAIERALGTKPIKWKFRCDCGNEKVTSIDNVRQGQVISCGCLSSRAAIGQRSLKHGHSIGFKKSRTAMAWRNAKTRCFNEDNENYSDYGARGITMCQEWADDFRAFLRDMGECPPGLTLERDDVNKGYQPGNCRWATSLDQARNKRNTLRMTEDQRIAVSQRAAECGVNYQSVWYHIQRCGKSPEEAISYLLGKRS